MTTVVEIYPARDLACAKAVLTLQRRAYAVEAEMVGDWRIPNLTETLGQVRAAPLRWLAAVSADLVGVLAWSHAEDRVEIDRLAVSPDRHREGIGRRLVGEVVAFGCPVHVATARDNLPARALYESCGFCDADVVEVDDGLWICRYEFSVGGSR